MRQAYPYHTLTRAAFDETLAMLAGKYPSDVASELDARVSWDRITDTLTPMRSARMVATISGGTIPDRGLYTVNLADKTRLGELDEEFVHESRVGDAFQLGSSTWRIRAIEHDRVIVVPAPGAPARMPFWHGEFMARSAHLTARVGELRRELDDARTLADLATIQARYHADEPTTRSLVEYVQSQRAVTRYVPDDKHLVLEHFRDEVGSVRMVLHAPFGGRVNAPWGMALGDACASGSPSKDEKRDDPLWACLDRAFRQIKGVAERSVARLLAEVPEIGSFSNRAVSKLVGLAPLADDSGQRSAAARSAAAVPDPAASSSSSPASSPNTTRTSPPSSTGCRPPERPKWSSASPSPANCYSPQRKSTRRAKPIRRRNLTTQTVAHPRLLRRLAASGGPLPASGERRSRAFRRDVCLRQPRRRGEANPPDAYAPLSASRSSGRERRRLPVAAKTAFAIAGAIVGTPGSPTPVGSSLERTMWTSTRASRSCAAAHSRGSSTAATTPSFRVIAPCSAADKPKPIPPSICARMTSGLTGDAAIDRATTRVDLQLAARRPRPPPPAPRTSRTTRARRRRGRGPRPSGLPHPPSPPRA